MAAKKKAEKKTEPKKEELVTVVGHKDIKVTQFIADTHNDYGCAMYHTALDLVFEEFDLKPGTTLTAWLVKDICIYLMKSNTEYLGEFTSMLENYYPTAISFSNKYITDQIIQGECPYCGDGTMIMYSDRLGSDEVIDQGITFNCSECDAEIHLHIESFEVTDNS